MIKFHGIFLQFSTITQLNYVPIFVGIICMLNINHIKFICCNAVGGAMDEVGAGCWYGATIKYFVYFWKLNFKKCTIGSIYTGNVNH